MCRERRAQSLGEPSDDSTDYGVAIYRADQSVQKGVLGTSIALVLYARKRVDRCTATVICFFSAKQNAAWGQWMRLATCKRLPIRKSCVTFTSTGEPAGWVWWTVRRAAMRRPWRAESGSRPAGRPGGGSNIFGEDGWGRSNESRLRCHQHETDMEGSLVY